MFLRTVFENIVLKHYESMLYVIDSVCRIGFCVVLGVTAAHPRSSALHGKSDAAPRCSQTRAVGKEQEQEQDQEQEQPCLLPGSCAAASARTHSSACRTPIY